MVIANATCNQKENLGVFFFIFVACPNVVVCTCCVCVLLKNYCKWFHMFLVMCGPSQYHTFHLAQWFINSHSYSTLVEIKLHAAARLPEHTFSSNSATG